MIALTFHTISILVVLFAFSLSQLVYGYAVDLNRRGVCNSDNCLNALRRHSAAASSFCSAYLQPTYTTSTVSFTTHCTENPTAVSTACSCLLSATSTTTSTITSTSTSTSTTSTSTSTTSSAPAGPTQCLASNNYGYNYPENTFSFESLIIEPNVETTVSNRGDCCRLCYSTPNCYGFAESSSSFTDTYLFCELEIIQPSTGLDVSAECPKGKVNLGLGYIPSPYNPLSPSGDGQGPCGIFPNGGL